MLIQLIYISTPVSPVAQATKNFIPVAKRTNDAMNITGMILSDETGYIQVLEGEKSNVDALFAKISKDSRHKDVRLIRYMEHSKREFKAWSMRHVRVKRLSELSDHDAVELLYVTADKELAKKTTRTVFLSSISFFSVLLGFFIGGPILEARYAPALTQVSGAIIEGDANHTVVLVSAKRARKTCTLSGFEVTTRTRGGVLKAHTNVLDVSAQASERFVAKLEAIPVGETYRVEIAHKCMPLWKQWQAVDLKNLNFVSGPMANH